MSGGVEDEGVLFTKQMRKATREIHNLSDSLVNAKLGLVLSNEAVWAEGLLVFYDIFAYLEAALDRCSSPVLAKLDIDGLRRVCEFETDLAHYLGADWKSRHRCRPEVQEYLRHLRQLEDNQPFLLAAYIYHLYMGLLSGGQILRKKREFSQRFLGRKASANCTGCAVVSFESTGYRPYELKRHLAAAMNNCASQLLDENQRQQLIDESCAVFVYNNSIIRSIRGANAVLLRKLTIIVFVLIAIISGIYYFIL